MRSANKPASLAELLGKDAGSSLGMADLPSLLGEKMPELPKNRIGKFRLTNALKLRFGPGFRNIPGIKNILEEFEHDMETENIVKMNKESRHGDIS